MVDHNRKIQSARRATAPYNFVPLPKKNVTVLTQEELMSDNAFALVEERLPAHDRFVKERLNGYFNVTLTTLSPLFIRGGLSTKLEPSNELSEFDRSEKEKEKRSDDFRDQVKNKPDFFSIDEEGTPLIPGSSLRGILRTLVEVITWSKVTAVTDKRLFFRTVEGATQDGGASSAGSAVGTYYRNRMVNVPAGESGVQPGFWHSGHDTRLQIEPCLAGRVLLEKVTEKLKLASVNALYDTGDQKPNAHPKWEFQYKTVWAKIDVLKEGKLGLISDLSLEEQQDYLQGTLVLTGPMINKKHAFVFFRQFPPKDPINVDKKLVKEFMNEDQLTQWQRKAFPEDRSRGRRRAGEPAIGEPVFYLCENGRLSFFGRAYMFRLPYEKSALDFVPPQIRRAWDVDFAEALFGFVRSGEDTKQKPKLTQKFGQGTRPRAYAGRVQVTDGVMKLEDHNKWIQHSTFSEEPLIPRILGGPRPTSFQYYLVQKTFEKQSLAHYGSSSDETEIRGFKFYWRHGPLSRQDLAEKDPYWIDQQTGKVKKSTQHTWMKPVEGGYSFTFNIHFQNLNDIELGSLAWALNLPGDPDAEYCHSLGMGKPFGMGAAKLKADLFLCDREKRYNSLFSGDTWSLEEKQTPQESYLACFEQHFLAELGERGKKHLREVERIRILLAMLRWDRHPSPEQLIYDDWRKSSDRRVLPGPFDVLEGPGPSPVESQGFSVGAILYLKPKPIKVLNNGDILLDSTKFDYLTTVLIPYEYAEVIKTSKPGKNIKCEVVEIRLQKNGETNLICKPLK